MHGTRSRYGYVHLPPAFGVLQFDSATYSVIETGGAATITVLRLGGANGIVTVDYATSNGTATAGLDYTAASGTLTWGDGDTDPKTFTVPVLADQLTEGNETVNLTLSNPTRGAALGGQTTAVLTIIDVPTLCDYCAYIEARPSLSGFWPLDDGVDIGSNQLRFGDRAATPEVFVGRGSDFTFPVVQLPSSLGVCGKSVGLNPTTDPGSFTPALTGYVTPYDNSAAEAKFKAAIYSTQPWTIEYVQYATRVRLGNPYLSMQLQGSVNNLVGVRYYNPSGGASQIYLYVIVNGSAYTSGFYNLFAAGENGPKAFLVSVRYDPTINRVQLLVNGVVRAFVTLPSTGFGTTQQMSGTKTWYLPNGDLIDGYLSDYYTTQDISLYTSALSDADIAAGYAALTSGSLTTCA